MYNSGSHIPKKINATDEIRQILVNVIFLILNFLVATYPGLLSAGLLTSYD